MTTRRGLRQIDLTMPRRALLTGGAACLTAVVTGLSVPVVRAQARPFSFKVGRIDVTVFSDGEFTVPVAFALPDTPAADIDFVFKANGLPRDGLPNAINVALLKTETDVILIDTGAGGDFMPGLGRLTNAIEAAGITAESVTKVIFTHAHADHFWGVIDPLDDNTRFANAEHIMPGIEHAFWISPNAEASVPDAFKRMAVGTQRRLKQLGDRVRLRKAGDEVASGVSLIDTAGHTPGHVSVLIKSGTDQLVIGGDVLTQHVVSFAKPAWRWGADMDADRAVTSRQRTLDMLATDHIGLLGYHLPWPGLGRVERKDTAFRFVAT
jgi:glyoxylase-like metal-dependent hydrolase (beta-lactamase superfamily II)